MNCVIRTMVGRLEHHPFLDAQILKPARDAKHDFVVEPLHDIFLESLPEFRPGPLPPEPPPGLVSQLFTTAGLSPSFCV